MKKGQLVFSLLALQITMAVMVVVSQIPIVKNGHRTNKAELVCQGASLGYTKELNKDGKVIASLVDVVNADLAGYMKNVPQDVKDYCKGQVALTSNEDKLALIKD